MTVIDGTAFLGCPLVYVYGEGGSDAETYCGSHANCVFVEEAAE